MRRKSLAIASVAALGLGAAGAWLVWPGAQPTVEAADHTDPPARTTGASADTAADIGDIYAFVRGENTILVMTFAGPLDPTADQQGTYDADVLYTLWTDEDSLDPTTTASRPIRVRFGQNTSGHWGVEIRNFPGAAAGSVETGPVEFANTVSTGGRYWVGLREDPFFFDLMGFQDTISSEDLAFDRSGPGGANARDFFAGKNITAIVLEIPNSALDGTFQYWATTARITGS